MQEVTSSNLVSPTIIKTPRKLGVFILPYKYRVKTPCILACLAKKLTPQMYLVIHKKHAFTLKSSIISSFNKVKTGKFQN